MFLAFKNFKKSDHIRMLDFLQDVNFLQNFLSLKVILHVFLLYCLDGYLFTGQFMEC